jgi:hypothetical protein
MTLRPYDEDDLPTYEWIHANVRPRPVWTTAVRPTQPMLDLDRLLAIHRGEPAEGPDPHPHVVQLDGGLWIHNGHHRWAVALLRGEPTIPVRVVTLARSAAA